jgi:hypothetical protein
MSFRHYGFSARLNQAESGAGRNTVGGFTEGR